MNRKVAKNSVIVYIYIQCMMRNSPIQYNVSVLYINNHIYNVYNIAYKIEFEIRLQRIWIRDREIRFNSMLGFRFKTMYQTNNGLNNFWSNELLILQFKFQTIRWIDFPHGMHVALWRQMVVDSNCDFNNNLFMEYWK